MAAPTRERPTASAAGELPRALFVLAAASTVVVATEFIVVGLLPVLSRDFGVSTAAAGWLVGAFALSASLLGPPLTVIASSLPPRRILIGTLLLFAGGNLAALLQPSFSMVMVVRIIQGAALPVFIGVGAATIARLAPPDQRGRSLALANTGFAVGVVIAMPAGIALAENGLWMPSFVALACLAIAAAGLVMAAFPPIHDRDGQLGRETWRILLDSRFVVHLALSVAVFAAMYAPYTYIAVWLAERAGMTNSGIALALTWFGAAGLLGNATSARVADFAPLRATALAIVAMVSAVIGLSLIELPAGRALLLAVWGVAHTACVTLCQVRVTLAGRLAPAFAMAMNISAANLGIALGALVGGSVVGRWGVNAIGWGALGFAPFVIGLAVALATPRKCGHARRSS
jgi:MFS transporter, DHA1 family, inner membrane transport protein